METYKREHHRIDKRIDATDFNCAKAVYDRFAQEIENNKLKNIYYQSLMDYTVEQMSQMQGKEYKILTESGFSAMTDVDGIKTPESYISSYNLYYNRSFKTNEITFLEFKQTGSRKTYNYWLEALQDINKRVFKKDSFYNKCVNGLNNEIQTLLQIANGSRIVVALTLDKTAINESYETQFHEYDYESKTMKHLTTKHRKEDFKLTLKTLTQ